MLPSPLNNSRRSQWSIYVLFALCVPYLLAVKGVKYENMSKDAQQVLTVLNTWHHNNIKGVRNKFKNK